MMSEEKQKLEKRKQESEKAIEFIKQKKKDITKIVQGFLSELNNENITRQEYDEKVRKALKGRTARQWIKYYDEYLDYYNYQIKLCDRLIKQEKKIKFKKGIKPEKEVKKTVYGSFEEKKGKNKLAFILKILIIFVLIGILISLFFILKSIGIQQAFGNIEEKVSTSFEKLTAGEREMEQITDVGDVGELVSEKPEIVIVLEDEDAKILEQELVQYQAVVGKPVKWKKQFTTDSITGFNIKLPEDSKNIKLKKADEDITNFADIGEEWIGKEINVKLKKSKITGNAIAEGEGEDYELVYETPAPEIEISQEGAKTNLKITGPEDVHYQNILSFAEIPETLKVGEENKLKLYQTKQNGINEKKQIPITVYDTDENGLLDYVEWLTPSLSEWEGYIIIEISKAEHLDVDKNFISDIYEDVKVLDEVWSEIISSGEYVRVKFEVALDNTKDITLYSRVVSGSPRIEVYEVDGNDKIAEFSELVEGMNQVFFTKLEGVQDVFDLRVVNGSVEIDYIVDPLEEEEIQECSDLGMVAYWTFDDGDVDTDNNIIRDVFGNNDGTILGATTGVNGQVGNAMEFDGTVNNYVLMTDSLFLLGLFLIGIILMEHLVVIMFLLEMILMTILNTKHRIFSLYQIQNLPLIGQMFLMLELGGII